MTPHFDPTPTQPIPPAPPAVPQPAAWLSPEQRRWLLLFAATVLGGMLGRWGIPMPSTPFPAEQQQQLAEIKADVKEIKAGQVQVMRAAGVPAK
jgi:hypothetical protein